MRLRAFLTLPAETTPFERKYLARLNRIALAVLVVHLPVITALAWWNDTGPVLALGLCAFALVGPLFAHRALTDRPRIVSCVIGVALMLMAAALVHVGQGPMQIEMHFHFFVGLASLAVFGNPRVIQVATATVVLHHLLCWWLFPASVFNYDAVVTVVGVHAIFVLLLAGAASFIARHFFDNVIELSRKVEARTRDLGARHRDVRLLLDHIDQGFLVLEGDGSLGPERSQVLERWFGERIGTATRWSEFLRGIDPDFAARTDLGWEAVIDDFLPLEVTLGQMPRRLRTDGRYFEVQYRPISREGEPLKALIVVDDVTEVAAAEAATRLHDVDAQLLQGILRDARETFEFLDDAEALLGMLADGSEDPATLKRALHTLKGNAGVAGFHVVARAAHGVEQHLVDAGRVGADELEVLAEPVKRMRARVEELRGDRTRTVAVEPEALDALEEAITHGAPALVVAACFRDLRRESAGPRLQRLAEHAERIAMKLGKGFVNTRVADSGVRFASSRWSEVWSAMVHAVRNAVDHGMESPEERRDAGKPALGRIEFRAYEREGVVVIEIEDDGRGIDLVALGRKAAEAGLPAETPGQIIEALWADGVSTASEVSETSGRGVGMSALRAAVEALGGSVRVTTASGVGTTVRVEVPRAAEDVAPEKRQVQGCASPDVAVAALSCTHP